MASKSIISQNQSFDISYEIYNFDKTKSIVFLHGWGANKTIMSNCFKHLFDEFKLVFIDLPGFGNSSINQSLDSYGFAHVIDEFLNSLDIQIVAILGHSFGGKIATLLKPKHLILLSSAGIVVKKSLTVRAKIMVFKLFKKLNIDNAYKFFASKDVKGMSKIMYECLKKVVDEKMDEKFMNFNGQSTIFWGKQDKATPLKSGYLIHKYLKNSHFYPLDGGHFFFAEHKEFIAQKIKERLCY